MRQNEAENDVQGRDNQSVLPTSTTDKQSDSADMTDGESTELVNQNETTERRVINEDESGSTDQKKPKKRKRKPVNLKERKQQVLSMQIHIHMPYIHR